LKLLDKSVNSLSERLNKLYPHTNSSNSSNDGIHYWKGRKIIPLDKWLKITKANTISRSESYNVKEGLQYFPDDYFAWMFPLGIPEEFKEEANKWYSEYIELMEYRRNPHYGRTKCFRCLLSPDMEESALFVGINKVISRAMEGENNETSSNNSKKDDNSNTTNSTTSTRTSIYPCKVLNRYACPYDNKVSKIKADANFDVEDLFALSKLAFQVELAFGHAYSMSKSNETIYETDFEAGKVKEIYANYYGDPYPFSTEYPLGEKLSKAVKRLSKVPINNVKDVYNALTNRDTFGKLLQQGLEEEYQQYKNQLIEFFMNMKDKVRIEDLIIYEPIWTLKREKGKCSTCNEFANIHCVNCYDNIWLCVDHWTHHKVDYHRL
jgi:hypothetical protein